MHVSIIVIIKNESLHIKKCLNSILSQNYKNFDYKDIKKINVCIFLSNHKFRVNLKRLLELILKME